MKLNLALSRGQQTKKNKKKNQAKKQEMPSVRETGAKQKNSSSKEKTKRSGRSGYNNYMRSECEVVKANNFGMTAKEVKTECRVRWGSLSQEEKDRWA